MQCAVCCSFSITRGLNTAEYRLNDVYCVCFQLFVYGFIILAEKVSLSKIRKSSPVFKRQTRFFQPEYVCLLFFKYKVLSRSITFIFVVKDWITVSSVKGYRLLSYVCPQRKYYTPYGKIFFQIP